jgi:beta-lactamase class D
MKNILSLTEFLVFFLSGILSLEASKPVDSIRISLDQLLTKWHSDAAEGNHDAYIGAMTHDGVYIGTDATEYWTTDQFSTWCKPYFDKKRTWDFTPFSRHVYLADDGQTAWFDELLDTQMGVCRGSGVLQKKGGQWKIAQYVLSATIPNSALKQVTSMKAGDDSSLVLKSIFDKYHLTGTILICDPATDRSFGYNSVLWDSGFLPASTFKIANTMIGLETGVIDTGFVFRWKGEKRQLPQWEMDLSLKEAFRVSCVPCYQELARKIGPERMKSYLAKMNYPGMDVSEKNIDLFWLEGNSRITPRQQLDFVRRLYEEKLPMKQSTMKAVKSIMVNEATQNYILSGKTGWAIRNGNNYGWFVGYIETKGKTFFIATLVQPENQEQTDDFSVARKTVTMEVLRYYKILW